MRAGQAPPLPWEPATALDRAPRWAAEARAARTNQLLAEHARLTATAPACDAAAERRMLWASVGVALDTVSSTVLSLGLTVSGNDETALTLAANAAAGLPVRLTLGQVQHHLLSPIAGPAVVWGWASPQAGRG